MSSSDTKLRIAGVGAYAPRFRLSADAVRDALDSYRAPGIDSVAVPDADEDPITMAVEAATRALEAADIQGGDLDAICLASTTLPTLDESPVPHLTTALDAPNDVDARTFSGSSAAGGEALATAASIDTTGSVLVVATDTVTGDPDSAAGQAAGAGAAALVLSSDGTGRIDEHGTATANYPGTRFRPEGDETQGLGITSYDRAAFGEVLAEAVEAIPADDVDAVALTMPDGKLPYRAARAAGLGTSDVATAETVSTLGDTGAASPLLELASALESDASTVLVAAYGSGVTCHAFRIDAGTVPVESVLDGEVELDYAQAMRYRGTFSSGTPAGGGANVPVPTYRRSLAQRYRLDAGACRACGDLVFPPENACPGCGAVDGYDTASLADAGEVVATTTIGTGGAPPEFVDQQNRSGAYGTAIVRFEPAADGDDTRTVDVPLQVVLADESEAPAVGDRVRTVFRVLYDQRGVRRYALKAVPDAGD